VSLLRRHCLGLLAGVAIAAPAVWGYTLLDHAWPDAGVTVSVNIPGASPSGTTWNDAFLQAADSWNSVVSGFLFSTENVYSHPCAGVPFPDNSIPHPEDFRQGVDFFPSDCGIPFNGGVLAVSITYTGPDGVPFDSDIIFNSAFQWDVYSGPPKILYEEFRRVAAHELGHMAGLGHEASHITLMHPFNASAEEPQADDIAGMNALYPATSNPTFIVSLEEPVQGLVHGGIGNLRGWAIADAGIDRVAIYIDGQYAFDAPYGGERTDVGDAYPGVPGSGDSGFSLAYGYSNLEPGEHTVTARAYANQGGFQESSATFTVVVFHKNFIPANDVVDTSGAGISGGGDEIQLNGVSIDGQLYDLLLKWRTAEQGFEIVEIR